MALILQFTFTSALALALASGFRILSRKPRSYTYGNPQIAQAYQYPTAFVPPVVNPYQTALAAQIYPQGLALAQQYQQYPGQYSGQQCGAANRFRCPSGECIPRRNLCNGRPDCRRGVDEQMFLCRFRRNFQSQQYGGYGGGGCMSQSQFQCGNNNCLPRTAMCNGYDDCGDMSDENTCGAGQLPYIPQNPWIYPGGYQPQVPIPPVSQIAETCSPQQFKCYKEIPGYTTSVKVFEKCIPQDYMCNDIYDCADRSDELFCRVGTTTPQNGVSRCGQEQFTCRSGQCIDRQLKCDSRSDCSDRSDEDDCPMDRD